MALRLEHWLSVGFLIGCSGGFEPECDVVEEKGDVAGGVHGRLFPRPGRGPVLVRCLDPRWPGTTAEVVELSIEGAVAERWSIELAGEYTALPSSCAWIGEGLAIISLETESLDGGVRSGLMYRFVDRAGAVQVERPVARSACTDCILAWTTQPTRDGVAVLLFESEGATQTLLQLGRDGAVELEADLTWLRGEGLQTVAELELSHRGDALVVTRGGVSWLLDDALERSAGPLHADGFVPAALDWDRAAGKAVAAWVTADGHLLNVSQALDGTERAPPERLSNATEVFAVRADEGRVSVGFADGPSMYLAMTDDAGNKRGGDLEIGAVQSPVQLLLHTKSDETSIFVASGERTDWMRVSCAQ